MSTGFDRGAFTERQSIDNRSDKSILLPSISKSPTKKNLHRSKPKKRSGYNKEESKIAKSYLKREVKPKDYISRVAQKAIETDDTKISKNPKKSVRNPNKESEKRLMQKDLHESPVKEDKSLEENKSHKGDMNIDKEYEELKKILNAGPKKEDDTPEKRLYMVKKVNSREDSGNQKESIASIKGGSRNILLDRNIPSTRSNQVVKTNNPKGNNHVGDGILYKVKGQNRYRANIITKPKKIALNEKYNKLEMGIVGSPIISTNSRIKALRKESKRRDGKVTSLDTRLPRISDDSYKELEQKPIVSSSVNLKLSSLIIIER